MSDLDANNEKAESTPKRRQRAPRAIQACDYCRLKKYRCSGTYPCRHCERHKVECRYRSNAGSDTAVFPISYVKSLEEKVRAAKPASQATPTSQTASDAGPDRASSNYPSDTNNTPDGPHHLQQPVEEAEADPEMTEVNPHTRGIEYHGSTSSFAFLSRARKEYISQRSGRDPLAWEGAMSLVSILHNNDFTTWQTGSSTGQPAERLDASITSPRACVFLDAYFASIHHMHPLIDKEAIYRKSEPIWRGQLDRVPGSFLNLYLSLISLGALIRTWDESVIAGMTRLEWSRRCFERVSSSFVPGSSGRAFDLDQVQTLFILAKICQNEIDLNLAYFYLGFAIRIAVSAGLNRATSPTVLGDSSQEHLSKIWWGMYSLELELCSALGRADSLGFDALHNQVMPPIDDFETAIIPIMVNLARIFRSVSLDVYAGNAKFYEKLDAAHALHAALKQWQAALPEQLRPPSASTPSLRRPAWVGMQQLVLQIRFLNVTMVLMRPFLVYASKAHAENKPSAPKLDDAANLGVHAALQTVELIHSAYQARPYFRSWWYNTTYVLFAASVLIYLLASPQPLLPESQLKMGIDKSLEVLESMDECVVAIKAAKTIRGLLENSAPRAPSRPPTAAGGAAGGATHEVSGNMFEFLENFTAPFGGLEDGSWAFDLDGMAFGDIAGFH